MYPGWWGGGVGEGSERGEGDAGRGMPGVALSQRSKAHKSLSKASVLATASRVNARQKQGQGTGANTCKATCKPTSTQSTTQGFPSREADSCVRMCRRLRRLITAISSLALDSQVAL